MSFLGNFIGQMGYNLAAPCAQMIDEVDANTMYVGYAEVGSATSGAVWQIKKIAKSGNVTTISWADGNSLYDNVWTNHTSLTYI